MAGRTKGKAPKKAAKAVRGNTYVITADGRELLKKLKGQGGAVLSAVNRMKLPTQHQIIQAIGKKLGAPNPAKTIGFHLTTLKGKGFIKFGPKPKA